MARWKVTRYKEGDPTPYTEEGREELRRRAELERVASREARKSTRNSARPSPAEVERRLKGPRLSAADSVQSAANRASPAPVPPSSQPPGDPAGRDMAAPPTGRGAHTMETSALSSSRAVLPADSDQSQDRRRLGTVQDVESLGDIEGLGALEDDLAPSQAAQDVSTKLSERRAAVAARSAEARKAQRGGPSDLMLMDEGVRKIAESSWQRPDQRVVVCRPDRWPEFIHIPLTEFGQGPAGARRHLVKWQAPLPESDGPPLDLPRPSPQQVLSSAKAEHVELAQWAEQGGVVLIWCAPGPQGQALDWSHDDFRHSWGLAIKERNRIVSLLRARTAAPVKIEPPRPAPQGPSPLSELPSIDLSPTREEAEPNSSEGRPRTSRSKGSGHKGTAKRNARSAQNQDEQ